MQRDFLFVANWKMQLSYNQSIQFVQHNYTELKLLAHRNTIIICPSFDALSAVKHEIKDLELLLGAQEVSAYVHGAYTGQVAAQSLKDIGCSYCIVGHSEQRKYNHQNGDIIAQKIAQLLAVQIVPIVCIGETAEERQRNDTIAVVHKQLAPMIAVIKKSNSHICIAYEPIWAIGTGNMPQAEDIDNVLYAIRLYMKQHAPTVKVKLLYGGSVDADSIKKLKTIEGIDGFLIGGASIDFQKLKKIVS